QRADVAVVVAAGRRVQVDAVTADADRVREALRRHLVVLFARGFHAGGGADVLFADREFRPDAARLADVGVFRQTVVGSDEVGPQPQSFPAGLAVRPRGLGLHPV